MNYIKLGILTNIQKLDILQHRISGLPKVLLSLTRNAYNSSGSSYYVQGLDRVGAKRSHSLTDLLSAIAWSAEFRGVGGEVI